MSYEFILLRNALRRTYAAMEKRYVKDPHEAVRLEFDEGKIICRSCLLVMEREERNDEERPLCSDCVDDHA